MPWCLLVWDKRTAVFPLPESLLHFKQWHTVDRSLAEEYTWNAISSFSLRRVSNPTPILFPTIRKIFRKQRWGHPTSLFVLGERTVLVLEVIASFLDYFLAHVSSILVFASERVTTNVSNVDEFLLLLNRLFDHLGVGSWSIASWITSTSLVSLFLMNLSKFSQIFFASSLFSLCLAYWAPLRRSRWRFILFKVIKSKIEDGTPGQTFKPGRMIGPILTKI